MGLWVLLQSHRWFGIGYRLSGWVGPETVGFGRLVPRCPCDGTDRLTCCVAGRGSGVLPDDLSMPTECTDRPEIELSPGRIAFCADLKQISHRHAYRQAPRGGAEEPARAISIGRSSFLA